MVALRQLDLDHPGAEIREQGAPVGPGEIAAQIEDGDAGRAALGGHFHPTCSTFPCADRRHRVQDPLRAVDDRVVDELAVELDRRTAFLFGLGERGDHALGEVDLGVARGEDAVDDRRSGSGGCTSCPGTRARARCARTLPTRPRRRDRPTPCRAALRARRRGCRDDLRAGVAELASPPATRSCRRRG